MCVCVYLNILEGQRTTFEGCVFPSMLGSRDQSLATRYETLTSYLPSLFVGSTELLYLEKLKFYSLNNNSPFPVSFSLWQPPLYFLPL